MVGVVAGMCVYVFHPPVPLYKSFYRANLLGFFFFREVVLFHAKGGGAWSRKLQQKK